jgi:hypothetical protein
MQFNATKSKCIHFGNRNASSLVHFTAEFTICGNAIENVDSWSHLEHIITSDPYDKDIQAHCRTMIGQTNNVMFLFTLTD